MPEAGWGVKSLKKSRSYLDLEPYLNPWKINCRFKTDNDTLEYEKFLKDGLP